MGKDFFGGKAARKNKTSKRRGRPAKAKRATKRRKYTRRAKADERTIMVPVPASMAFQFGLMLGQTINA